LDEKEVLAWLERRGTRRAVQDLGRYGIEAEHAFGVPMAALLTLAKRLGKDHALRQWSASPRLYVKRGGFVLMACLALHDKAAAADRFLAFLPLIERGARDERNFVKKGVSWALRSIGRRNPGLHTAALALARRLASTPDPACRWVGKDTLRELASPKLRAELARRARRAAAAKRPTAARGPRRGA
jgi:hypothetical protein